MAYTTINKPTDYFNTVLYTGNSTDNRTVTGVGFQPDLTWIKLRNAASQHELYDAVRGANKPISSNLTTAESTTTNNLKSFDSDGFTLGTATAVNGGYNFVSWNWKANGAGSSNTDGTITATVSASQTAGFSIVSYTGNGNSSQTVGHGLSSAPELIISKNRDASQGWLSNTSVVDGTWDYLFLNTTASKADSSFTLPTSSLINLNSSSAYSNTNGEKVILYCFHSVQGYSKIGIYEGNANADGPFVYTGFKPAFIIIKEYSNSGQGWCMKTSALNSHTGNQNNYFLKADANGAEHTSNASFGIDFLSNGFKLRTTDGIMNGSGRGLLYIAFAEASLVGSNNIAATAR